MVMDSLQIKKIFSRQLGRCLSLLELKGIQDDDIIHTVKKSYWWLFDDITEYLNSNQN